MYCDFPKNYFPFLNALIFKEKINIPGQKGYPIANLSKFMKQSEECTEGWLKCNSRQLSQFSKGSQSSTAKTMSKALSQSTIRADFITYL